jgi:hypothetical protein
MLNLIDAIGMLPPQLSAQRVMIDPLVIANGRHAFALAVAIILAFVGYLIDRSGAKWPSHSQPR